MKKSFFLVPIFSLFAGSVFAETITVKSGSVDVIPAGRRFEGDVLVKDGPGTLDLSGAVLANSGLEIREGSVIFSAAAGTGKVLSARYLRFNVTKTRPARSSAPEYGGSGSQFSEFRLFLNGKMLPFPKSTIAVDDRDGRREGPSKGIDNNFNTKCYYNPLEIDFGCEVTFDAYSFATANDAIGRDPSSWRLEVGACDGSARTWQTIGTVNDFAAPLKRNADIGTTFPVSRKDMIPPGYPITVGGKGRLVLSGVSESLENIRGCGLIEANKSTVEFAAGSAFAGTVSGDATVTFRK